MALSKMVDELTWLSRLLVDFVVPVLLQISIFCDNQAALHIAKNHVFHERIKHIEIDCHFIWAKLGNGLI